MSNTYFSWITENLKKSRVTFVLLSLVVICSFILPDSVDEKITPREAMMSLIMTKTVGVSLGILIAHYTRVFRFPYLDLSTLIEEHHWSGVIFLAVWYGVIIWAFSMGG